MSRSRNLATALSATALATVLLASPAAAVTLPEGQRITVIDELAGAVYEASSNTAALTPVGSGAAVDGRYVSAVEVDEAGLGYALLVAGSPGGSTGQWGASQVVPFDASTGSVGTAVDVTIPSVGSPGLSCSALDLRAGVYYTSCFTGTGDAVKTHFGTLDPVTGALDVLRTFNDEILFSAFASDPFLGEFWAFEYRPVDGYSGSWIVDPDDWSFTTYLELDHPVWGADYDRGGRLFVASTVDDLPAPYAALSVLTPDEGAFDLVGPFALAGAPIGQSHQLPLTVSGTASPLPQTGRAEDSLPVALGAVMMVLAGIALVWSGRIEEQA